MGKNEIFRLCDQIRETCYSMHRFFGPGHLEKVYENSLAHRLRKQGLAVEQKIPLNVYDEDGTNVGIYEADLLVSGCLLIELKAVTAIHDQHVSLLLGYLRTTGLEHGLLVNFGESKLKIKKYILDKYVPPMEEDWH